MKDPYQHTEFQWIMGIGAAEIRTAIADVGLATDLPMTCKTGCGKRRRWSQVTKDPDKVTCLACRDWAVQRWTEAAEMAEALLESADEELYLAAKTTPEAIEHEREHATMMAERFRS